MSDLTPETLDKWMEEAFRSGAPRWGLLSDHVLAWEADLAKLARLQELVEKRGAVIKALQKLKNAKWAFDLGVSGHVLFNEWAAVLVALSDLAALEQNDGWLLADGHRAGH